MRVIMNSNEILWHFFFGAISKHVLCEKCWNFWVIRKHKSVAWNKEKTYFYSTNDAHENIRNDIKASVVVAMDGLWTNPVDTAWYVAKQVILIRHVWISYGNLV